MNNGYTVTVVIEKYLKSLQEVERQKPLGESRRHVPDAKEIAAAAGVSLASYYKWSSNRSKGINRALMGGTITLLRDCGFETTFNDILEYVPKLVMDRYCLSASVFGARTSRLE